MEQDTSQGYSCIMNLWSEDNLTINDWSGLKAGVLIYSDLESVSLVHSPMDYTVQEQYLVVVLFGG